MAPRRLLVVIRPFEVTVREQCPSFHLVTLPAEDIDTSYHEKEMALIAVAETAQDVASGFNKFLDQVPEYSSEITGLISECFAISSGLRELNTGKDDPRYYRAYNDVRPKVQIVQQSLEYTFRDVLRLFAGLGRPTHISTRIAYNQVWREIDDHFWQEGRTSLVKRLENDRLFLQQLTCILMDGSVQNKKSMLHSRLTSAIAGRPMLRLTMICKKR